MTDTKPEPFDLRSHDVPDDKRAELLRLFPEARTEGGHIDYDQLRRALGDVIDAGRERYGMVWPGKADCFKAIQQPSLGTLLPDRDESVDFDTTENLIIEGDNLEVLKLLQKSYLGKVKMIYIDPPYNTGNDFIYPDDFSESLRTYLEYTGQMDAEGRKFSTNTEADGRFHSKWLNMMYPRLYLARNLLREEGVILISIDDSEFSGLRTAMNEVFGEENFLASFVRRRRMATGMRDEPVSPDHEYVLAFARNKDSVRLFGSPRTEDNFPFKDEVSQYASTDLTVGMTRAMRPNQYYEVVNPATGIGYWPTDQRVWRFEPSTMTTHIGQNDIIWPDDSTNRMSRPRFKTRYFPGETKLKPVSTWVDRRTADAEDDTFAVIGGLNEEGTKELRNLFGEQLVEYPKPVSLLRSLVALASANDDIVLDFFAGSGTTAHAVLDLNKQDRGCRKFILVQLPEPSGRDDYPTIADICEERVRRVIKKLNEEDAGKLPLSSEQKPDRGFRVFKLAESNFLAWNAAVEQGDVAALEKQLEMHIDHTRDGRSAEDQLYELLLKSGFPLTTSVVTLEVEGKTVYSIAEGEMLVCLDGELTLDAVRAMAARKPSRVVCLDEGFAGNDQLKTNAVQTMKDRDIVFKTV